MDEHSVNDGVLTRELVRFFDRMSAHFPGHVMQRVLEPDGRLRYSYVSPGLSALGLDRDAIMAESSSQHGWIHPEDAARWRAAVRLSAETLEPIDEEVRVIGDDGRVRWVRSLGNPRKLPSGAIVWDGIALDVNEKREALDALRLAKAEADAAEAAKARQIAAVTTMLDATLTELRSTARRAGREAEFNGVVQRLTAARDALGHGQAAVDALALPSVEDDRIDGLSDRHRAVLELVADARSNKEIAATLGITVGTVKLHVVSILRQLNATNRTEAAIIFKRFAQGSRVGS